MCACVWSSKTLTCILSADVQEPIAFSINDFKPGMMPLNVPYLNALKSPFHCMQQFSFFVPRNNKRQI